MDREALVASAKAVIEGLESSGIAIRGAMWVRLPESEKWRLWLVGPKNQDQREFYQAVADLRESVEEHLPSFSLSDVELKKETDQTVLALAMFAPVDGFATVEMSRNMVNGVYTPDGILFRMALG